MTAKRMTIMLLACLVVFGGIFGMKFMGAKAMNDYFDNMPQKAVTIVSAKAEAMNWSQSVLSVGSIVAVNGANITTEANGIVQAIHFTGGSQVEAGDLLVSLDARTEKADLVRLQAQAAIARSNMTRSRDLHRRKALSDAEYDRARAESAAADAAVVAQQARLDQKEVRAPFAGVLGSRQVNVGDYLQAGTPMVSLQALDNIEVRFAMPENYLPLVKAGLPMTVSVDAWGDEQFPGKVTVIEPAVDAATRNVYGRGALENPEGKLLPGMFAVVRIQRGESQDVIAIPRTAIKYDSYGTSVFVLAPSEDDPEQLIAQNRFIRIGQARGDYVEVLEGLSSGDEVAAGGLLKLRNGVPVTIDNSIPIKPSLNPDVANT